MNELIKKVEQWSIERNLHVANPQAQALKVVEEFTETLLAHQDRDFYETVDGIGDTFVTLIILCQQLEIDFKETLSAFKILYPKGKKVTWETDVYVSLNGISTGVAKGQKKIVEYSIIAIIGVIDSIIANLNQSESEEVDYEECLSVAYNEIEDRTGKMVNGTFIKSEDLQ